MTLDTYSHVLPAVKEDAAIAIAVMFFYPITEERAYEIRSELERRRGKL